ncbi:uncharacterized protein A1O9_03341 [Exophiala aquamarina CBS 119918]|uniref:CFEM domain-containing protein n=1 Tax=Exophiala aquamarina CBS 119918 TaxID=1182545 RepID=A0A072PPJ6_9EURO|nr:uncharacterized protein A1O9_03341 [Exophiala aquamarina CBS 119918]KEF61771.1 hypothetical protein A1O9_03341 [Exophiala aquamarina CBS 119918]
MQKIFVAMQVLVVLLLAILGLAQDDLDQCALSCISNVASTNCSQSEWSCLCANNLYIERMNNCTVVTCLDASDQQDTFSVVAELCAVIGVPITIGPEATILTTTSNPLLTTNVIATQSELPPVMNATSITTSEYSSGSSRSTTSSVPQTGTGTSNGPSATGSVASSTTSADATTNQSYRLLSPWPTILILGIVAGMITGKAL